MSTMVTPPQINPAINNHALQCNALLTGNQLENQLDRTDAA
ncbi:hypothetical protein [Rhodopirellula halodulae]|nr:hypothetical protein [Rhodopirellula sp. JC737]